MPTAVLEPVDATETAAMLAEAGRQRFLVIPRGSGTKLAWRPAASDAVTYISTKRLSAPVQHFAGDLVATIPSGATLAHANAVLAQAGQWLPLDPCYAECATIGGIVAANDSGPRRHKHGAPRDLIIGIEIALTDGTIAKAGGRVVKNVAGYDLSRLLCGSFGSLAVITSATFKLTPLPPASRTVVVTCADPATAARLALVVASQPVTPSAIEIEAPSPRLLIRFETTERAADRMADSTCALIQEAGASTEIVAARAESELWTQHESSIWSDSGLVVKVSVLPTDVGGCLEMLRSIGPGADWFAAGRAALGVLLIRLNDSVASGSSALARLRQHVGDKKGTLVVLRGASSETLAADSTSDQALRRLLAAVKSQFDPGGILPALP